MYLNQSVAGLANSTRLANHAQFGKKAGQTQIFKNYIKAKKCGISDLKEMLYCFQGTCR